MLKFKFVSYFARLIFSDKVPVQLEALEGVVDEKTVGDSTALGGLRGGGR